MSKSNAELAVEGLVAYQQGDEDKLRELFDPEIEIYGEPGMINAGRFTGFEGFRQWVSQWEEAWEEISYEPLDFIEVDDCRLVVRTRVTGRGAGSGLETDREFGYLYAISDGRATRFHLYDSAERAVEAARRLARE
jgi:ketosteroid isomerase-like protein